MKLPSRLYDPRDSLTIGSPIRACGYLMRIRLEYLLTKQDGERGLRRAMHMGPLIETGVRSYTSGNPSPGYFALDLKQQLAQRLAQSRATLQPQEKHFASPEWWASLDKDATRSEMRSNLDRLLNDECLVTDPTECLMLGIELHVLYNIKMRERFGAEFMPIIAGNDYSNPALANAIRDFGALLQLDKAA